MSPLIALVLGMRLAAAEDLVVHGGDEVAARAAVLRIAPQASLRASTLPGLLSVKAPFAYGGGTLFGCTGLPTRLPAVADALDGAEGAIRYLEFAEATLALDRAASSLDCLVEIVDPRVASRVHFLRGVLAHARGDDVLARAAFARAYCFRPGLAWDTDLPPDAKDLFEAVASETRTVAAVDLVPDASAPVWLDGLRVDSDLATFELPAGDHLLQIEGPTVASFELHMRGDAPVDLVFPGRIDIAAVNAVGTAHGDKDLALALLLAVGPGVSAWVVADDGVWHTTTGTTGFERMADPTIPLSPLPAARVAHPAPHPAVSALLGGGAAAFVGGSALAVASYLQGMDAFRDSTVPATWGAYDDAVARRDGAAGRLLAGEILSGGGAVLAGIGFTFLLAEPRR